MRRTEQRKGNNPGHRTDSRILNLVNSYWHRLFAARNRAAASTSQQSPSLPGRRRSSSRENSKSHHLWHWLGLSVNSLVVVLGLGSVLFQWGEIQQITQSKMNRGCRMTFMAPRYKRIRLGNEEDEKLPPGYGLYHVIDYSYSHGRSLLLILLALPRTFRHDGSFNQLHLIFR